MDSAGEALVAAVVRRRRSERNRPGMARYEGPARLSIPRVLTRSWRLITLPMPRRARLSVRHDLPSRHDDEEQEGEQRPEDHQGDADHLHATSLARRSRIPGG